MKRKIRRCEDCNEWFVSVGVKVLTNYRGFSYWLHDSTCLTCRVRASDDNTAAGNICENGFNLWV